MIRLQDLTPEVYYQQSRDFQYIGRLYDIVLNAVKTNVDMIYSVPSADAAGSKMIDLLATTLGFRAKHEYNVKQLAAICSIFPLILRNKGNIQSILLIGQALLNSEGVTDSFGYTINEYNPYLIQLFVPPGLSDINLLLDLIPYVLPAGMTVNIVRAVSNEKAVDTAVATADKVNTYYPTKSGDSYNPADTSKIFVPGEQYLSETQETDQHTSGAMTNATVYLTGVEPEEDTED